MKFQVIGASRDTGARMTLEFEAESKAAAERKAAQQGMEVRSVREVGGSVAVSGDRITVTVDTDYSATFLPVPFPVQATATAELITQ